MATTRRPRLDIKADAGLVASLDSLKPELGTTSRTSTIRALIQSRKDSAKSRTKGDLPRASPSIMRDSTPAIITGPTGSGKTTTIRALLPKEGSVFVLDVSDEYPDFERIGLGDFFGYDWAKGGRIRYVPTNALSATAEGESVLMQVAMLMREPSKPLASWILIVEEGDRFLKSPNLKTLLGEGRKFASKILVPMHKWTAFKDVAPVYLPIALGDSV